MTTTHWPVYSPFAKLHYGKGKAEGLEEGRSEGLIEGLIEGEREALLEVLQARGLEVTKDQRARVAGCADLEQLKAWVRGAVTAASTSDLFAQNPAASQGTDPKPGEPSAEL